MMYLIYLKQQNCVDLFDTFKRKYKVRRILDVQGNLTSTHTVLVGQTSFDGL